MNKARDVFMKNLRYVCLMGVIALGLIMIGVCGSDGGGSTSTTTATADTGGDGESSGGGGDIEQPMDVEIPSSIASIDYDKVCEDPDTGARMVRNEVLIKFNDNVDDDTIKEVIPSIDGTVVGGIEEIGIYQIHIPDSEDLTLLKEVINDLEDNSSIKLVSPNIELHENKTPDEDKDPAWDEGNPGDSWDEDNPGGNN